MIRKTTKQHPDHPKNCDCSLYCSLHGGMKIPGPTKRGNCYVTCEALYHLLGGKAAGWRPATVEHEGDTHWFLVQGSEDFEYILDPTKSQFKTPVPYHKARGRGFLTKRPSKRAKAMMEAMLWQP